MQTRLLLQLTSCNRSSSSYSICSAPTHAISISSYQFISITTHRNIHSSSINTNATTATAAATTIAATTTTASATNTSTNHGSSTKKFFSVSDLAAFPKAFSASAVKCGIKKGSKHGGYDLALIASKKPCTVAAMFTQNKFKAAPVLVSQKLIANNQNDIWGVVINSGCANACTGERGIVNAQDTIELATQHGIRNPVVMSTGVIGPFLPMDKLTHGIADASTKLDSASENWQLAAKAIMTTDTAPKLLSRQVILPSDPLNPHAKPSSFTIAGMCKGAGMIHPNLATMLGVLVTDCNISPACLNTALKHAVTRSFNCISIDGDTSTNDTVCVLANGAADNPKISKIESSAFRAFQSALTKACIDLSQMIVRDGEGATKFVTICVKGASSYGDAHTVASSVAKSCLVKTALYGQDANWGRILCAVGYSGVNIKPEKVNLYFGREDSTLGRLHIVKEGRPHDTNEIKASKQLKQRDIHIEVELGIGDEEATLWTCDLSPAYVGINADYRS